MRVGQDLKRCRRFQLEDMSEMQDAAANVRRMLAAAEELSKNHMQSYDDPSHDWLHVSRVRSLAMKLARTAIRDNEKVDLLVVELAALFHDLHDSKYASTTASIWEDLETRFFGPWLADQVITEDRARLICKICENVSYSKEVKRIQARSQTPWHETCLELHCVQDADKLDAMGGIGIMRCAAFSATKRRPLLDHGNPEDSITHFHDKLLKLKGMLKTQEGRAIGEKRHRTMSNFVAEVNHEWMEVTSS